MEIRSITADELDLFFSFPQGTEPTQTDESRKMLMALWEEGQSQPDWCFVAEEKKEVVGRVSYRRYGRAHAAWLMEIQLPWLSNHFRIGGQLLRESLKSLFNQGVTHTLRHLNSHQLTVEEERTLLESVGFTLLQEKTIFIREFPATPMPVPKRLVFRSLEQVGEAAFVDAIQQASVNTLDPEDRAIITSVGPVQMARDFFALLQSGHWRFEPHWWQLAYTPAESLAGFVQPLLFHDHPTQGTIGYIGVTPGQRGNHYVDDLLLKAHQVLQTAGALSMYCDTNIGNFPMIQAFGRTGYHQDGSTWRYEADIQGLFE